MSAVRRQDVAGLVGVLVILELRGRDVLSVVVGGDGNAEISWRQHADTRTLVGITPDSDGTKGYGSTLITLAYSGPVDSDTARTVGNAQSPDRRAAGSRLVVSENGGYCGAERLSVYADSITGGARVNAHHTSTSPAGRLPRNSDRQTAGRGCAPKNSSTVGT